MKRRWLMPLCLAAACSSSTDPRFPKAFRFGTATAGFQVEMGCPTVPGQQCEDRSSDWYDFITRPELVGDALLYINGDPPSSGPGFFELYAQDLDRAAGELHNNAFRLSLEWSRIFPAATDGVSGYDALHAAASQPALAYYHALFAAMRARGLAPLVTLDHYTLPSWIHDAYGCHVDLDHCTRRGWLDHDRILAEIAKYAGFVAQEFGGEVDDWATLNEPFTALILAGYLFPTAARTNPPGVFLRGDAAKLVFVTLIEAHARMYDAVHAGDTVDADGDGRAARVGIVYNLQAVAPQTSDPLDVAGAKNLDYLENQALLDGVGLGRLDADLNGQQVTRADLEHRLDFLGINYYARTVVVGSDVSFLPELSPLVTFDPLTVEADYSYPRGIYEVLKSAQRYHVPLLISETGVADPDDNGAASQWVAETLGWVKRAINEGVRVEGYYYWSLMDNYEWNHGMSVKMGLYAVDPADAQKVRRARGAVATYGRIAAASQIPADLAASYPAR
jgi:beta-glucosidase/6-phospho-beta-glucosidase/beta-galactosidase